ncbi:MAG: DNA topoisomerase I [Deltaproteobacteria bacterium RIFOXYA12_FULL_61_11]|nr:MAG: DNA topoisomerase I [Deltaproteobacteria bacterium RIFOXYA12_FULL_61_11]
MSKPLIIVESPTKANTIRKYLKGQYEVLASVGHIKDLPKSELGVDVAKNFEPRYVTIRGKNKILAEIRKQAAESSEVFLAPDPDREGEAIAWHLYDEIRGKNTKVYRVLFNEITKNKIIESLGRPEQLNLSKYHSQVARRVLDRLVGYNLSPLLWDKVRRGLSAGRVQSVSLRLICDREREIRAFVKEEYWKMTLQVAGPNGRTFSMKLVKIDGKDVNLPDQRSADEVRKRLEGREVLIDEVQRRERRRNPGPPFITSSMQMESSSRLRYPARKTMMLAQRLYEGVELGGEAVSGLITYMRTDSVRTSEEALTEVRAYIAATYGQDTVPEKPNHYTTKKSAQDAHEAIRPTSMGFVPDHVRGHLSAEQFRLYELIWRRFVASQMKPAVYDQTVVETTIAGCTFRATGSVLRLPGFLEVYQPQQREDKGEDESELPAGLEKQQKLDVLAIEPSRHFTQPPPRFSESSLVKELEENGIGRPSTYATILSTITDKEYVHKQEGRFVPTELGMIINDLLVDSFPTIMNIEFTASLEEQLDHIEQGREVWQTVIGTFYEGFRRDLEVAREEMRNVKREETPTEITCSLCGGPMVIKWGRNGSFLACSRYPDCKGTREFVRDESGALKVLEEERTGERCAKCGKDMVYRHGRFGRFLACAAYPDCKYTRSPNIGVGCPEEGCTGMLAEKRSKRGKVFYGCDRYPACRYISWDRPVKKPCPTCGAPFLVEKKQRFGEHSLTCPREGCGYREVLGDDVQS